MRERLWEDDDTDVHGSDVTDRTTGKPRRLAEMCSTCILRPGDLMHLGPERLRDFINEVRAKDSYVVCHQTISPLAPDGVLPAICRGYADRFTSNYLRIMERLGGFVDVPPPTRKG